MSGSETIDKPIDTTTAAPADNAARPADTPLSADPAGDKPSAAPATWPEDWRTRMAGDDEATGKLLGKYGDPAAVAKALREANLAISRRAEVPKAPGADAKPEDVAAWRKQHGIPEAAAGYLEKLPEGLVIAEGDKDLVGIFAQDMHGKNVAPDVVHAALGSYYKVQAAAAAKRQEMDVHASTATTDILRQEWGNGEYRGNINAIMGFLDTMGSDVRDIVLNARGPDGVPIASNPSVLKGLLSSALAVNPAATILPGSGGSSGQGVEDRIAAIEGIMRGKDARTAYWGNEPLQKEYRSLLDARTKMAR